MHVTSDTDLKLGLFTVTLAGQVYVNSQLLCQPYRVDAECLVPLGRVLGARRDLQGHLKGHLQGQGQGLITTDG